MTVKLEKDLLLEMLVVLDNQIRRTAAAPRHRGLRIEAQDETLAFSVNTPTEHLVRKFATAAPTSFCVQVNFNAFRNAVQTCRTRLVPLSLTAKEIRVAGKSMSPGKVPAAQLVRPRVRLHADLAPGIIGMCARAAQVVDPSSRIPSTHGIYLSESGITAMNRTEIIHLPCPVGLGGMTIPVPFALMETKCEDAGRIELWPDAQWKAHFRMIIGPWEWTAPEVSKRFPGWKRFMPRARKLVRRITLSKEAAAQLLAALRGLSDPGNRLTVVWSKAANGRLDVCAGTWNGSYPASFRGPWEKVRQGIRRKILLHILSLEHDRFAFGDPVYSPFVATGGIGQFIAMPQFAPVDPSVEEGPPIAVSAMHEAIRILDELDTDLENFREKLKQLLHESTVLHCRVREVASLLKP